MRKEPVKRTVNQGRAIKDTASKLMEDQKLQAEGKFDQPKDAAHNVADLKGASRGTAKTAKHRLEADTSSTDVTVPGDD